MSLWLHSLGAELHGLSLSPDTSPSLWQEIGSGCLTSELIADIRELDRIAGWIASVRPQIVIHMAAQALVRPSFSDPIGTFETNVGGTANVLQALRHVQGLQTIVVVTTDKVYANEDSGRDFVESDPLGGDDPYSASKAAAELVTHSYAKSFFDSAGVPVVTARAGNVIGGGDWSEDRLIPDLWRAVRSGSPLLLRDPQATRPWQHVLEPLRGYLLYAEASSKRSDLPRSLNFGPRTGSPVTVGELASAIASRMGMTQGWMADQHEHPPERKLLSLDPSLALSAIGWEPRLDYRQTAEWTADWYARHLAGADARSLCLEQIKLYSEAQ
jgi:CDP-glucose 4,6-dehydratase